MKLNITAPAGMVPAVSDRNLPDTAASAILNAVPVSGGLEPIREVTPYGISISADVRSFAIAFGADSGVAYPDPDALAPASASPGTDYEIITRTDPALFVRGAIASDAHARWYSAGELGAQVHPLINGARESRSLGVLPLTPGGSIITGGVRLVAFDDLNDGALTDSGPADAPADAEIVTAAYWITAVTDMGEEGVPSLISKTVDRFDYESEPFFYAVKLTLRLSLEVMQDPSIVTIRLYRTEGSGVALFCADIAKADFTPDVAGGLLEHFDYVQSAELGEACASMNYDRPDGAMAGIADAGNGMFVGWFDNVVCFCEPYYPHAWPIEYQYKLPAGVAVMRVVATLGGLLVVTDQGGFIFVGSDPLSMSQTRLDSPYGCVSALGVVDMGEYALYPSAHGLVALSVNGEQLITEKVFTRQQWSAWNPQDMIGFRYRDRYLAVIKGMESGFIFDPNSGIYPIQHELYDETYWRSYSNVVSGQTDKRSGVIWLLFVDQNGSAVISSFDTWVPAVMSWSSKEFALPPGVVLSCGMVDFGYGSSIGNCTIQLEEAGTGARRYHVELSAAKNGPFRLPPGRPTSMVIAVSTRYRLNSITLAGAMGELL